MILKPGAVPVLLVQPYGPSYTRVIEKLKQDSSIQVIECSSAFDAVPLARQLRSCVIMCHAAVQDDVVKQVTMLKLLNDGVMSGRIRVLFTHEVRAEGFEERMKIYPFSEVIREPISEKSLAFKIDRYARALPKVKSGSASHAEAIKAVRSGEAQAEGAGAGEFEGPSKPIRAQIGPAGMSVRTTAPLEIESDCWLIRGGGAKRVGDRWVLRIKGPGPLAGRWIEIESDDHGHRCWQWTPSDPDNDPYIREQGAWIFKGQRHPEFVEERWHFVGQRPTLAFYYEGASYGDKFHCDERGTLIVAKDSAVALQNATSFEATWHKVIKRIEEEPEVKVARSQEPARSGGPIRAVSESGSASGSAEGSSDNRAAVAATATAPEILMDRPLELESDFWLFERSGSFRVANRWLVRMVGPGPRVGYWDAIDHPDSHDQYWRWIPEGSEGEEFLREEGAWVFRGLLPKFEDGRWIFVGSRPELAFFYEGQSYGAKITTDERGNLHVAYDSPAARASTNRIAATLGPRLRESSLDEPEDDAHVVIKMDEEASGPRAVATSREDQESGELRAKASRSEVTEPGEFEIEKDESARGISDLRGESKNEAARWNNKIGREAEKPEWNATQSEADERRDWGANTNGDSPEREWNEATQGRKAEGQRRGTGVGPGEEVEHSEEVRHGDEVARGPGVGRGRGQGPGQAERAREKDEKPPRKGLAAVTSGAGKIRAVRSSSDDTAENSGEGVPAVIGVPKEKRKKLPPNEFRMPVEKVGPTGGEWGLVSEGEGDDKWFVFVPKEILGGTTSNLDSIPLYWTYLGRRKPSYSRDRTEFIFKEREPQSWSFNGLREEIQVYLRERLPALLGGGKGGVAGTVPKIVARVEKVAKTMSPAMPEKALDVLKRIERELTASAAAAGVGAGAGFGTGTGVSASLRAGSRARARVGADGAESGVNDEAQAEGAAEGVSGAADVVSSAVAGIMAPGTSGAGPQAMRAESVPGPSLRPIAIAFLVSELVSRPGATMEEVARRYCAYIAASCGGLRVELWSAVGGQGLVCVGTDDGREGALKAAAQVAWSDGKVSADSAGEGADEVLGAAIISLKGEKLGALVISGAGATLVETAYAEAVGAMSAGILLTPLFELAS